MEENHGKNGRYMKNGPYNLVIAPKDYPGMKYRGRYAYEHTVEWWKYYKTTPPKGYEIHHINGDHRDNKIENLKLLTSFDHKKVHGELRSTKVRIYLKCAYCKTEFFMCRSDYSSKIKRSKSGKLYCSRKCQQNSMVGVQKIPG
jgi:hypothetical protein